MAMLLAALLAATEARDSAREYARRAGIAYNLGHYDEAGDLYESAYRLIQDATLLFNIGQSYRLSGHPDRALAAYKGFLRTAPADDANRAAVAARVGELDAAIAAAKRETAKPAEPPRVPGSPGDTTGAVGGPSDTRTSAGRQALGDAKATANASGPRSQAASTETMSQSTAFPAAADESDTMIGAQVGAAGRQEGRSGSYRGFARATDNKRRVYELGYFRSAVYPMNPTYRHSALYGIFTTTSGWELGLGALGRDGGWHLAASQTRRAMAFGLRVEGESPEALCSSNKASVLYAIPESRLHIPVSPRVDILGAASYRGKLSAKNCDFAPSLLTLDIAARWAVRSELALSAGLGHYGLYDFGAAPPPASWPGRENAAEVLHVGARYTMGPSTVFCEFRTMSYAGGTLEASVGVQFRSGVKAP